MEGDGKTLVNRKRKESAGSYTNLVAPLVGLLVYDSTEKDCYSNKISRLSALGAFFTQNSSCPVASAELDMIISAGPTT